MVLQWESGSRSPTHDIPGPLLMVLASPIDAPRSWCVRRDPGRGGTPGRSKVVVGRAARKRLGGRGKWVVRWPPQSPGIGSSPNNVDENGRDSCAQPIRGLLKLRRVDGRGNWRTRGSLVGSEWTPMVLQSPRLIPFPNESCPVRVPKPLIEPQVCSVARRDSVGFGKRFVDSWARSSRARGSRSPRILRCWCASEHWPVVMTSRVQRFLPTWAGRRGTAVSPGARPSSGRQVARSWPTRLERLATRRRWSTECRPCLCALVLLSAALVSASAVRLRRAVGLTHVITWSR